MTSSPTSSPAGRADDRDSRRPSFIGAKRVRDLPISPPLPRLIVAQIGFRWEKFWLAAYARAALIISNPFGWSLCENSLIC